MNAKYIMSFSSPELKAHLSFFWSHVHRLLSVRPTCCLYTFLHMLPFSRTTGSISTKLGTKQNWVNGILVCSNKGPRTLSRGDNHEIAKIHWRNLKKSSQEPLYQFQPNFAHIQRWRFLSLLKNVPLLIPRRVITEIIKWTSQEPLGYFQSKLGQGNLGLRRFKSIKKGNTFFSKER